jgi:7tm Odorant receptor
LIQVNDSSEIFRLSTFLIPVVLEIFLPCFFGNKLTLASSKLSTSLFHSNWIDEDKSFKKIVKIFMENTKKDLKISAFGIFDVNLATFSRIGNAAYSLLAVLKHVNN